MFHYKTLQVYQTAKDLYRYIRNILTVSKPDRIIADQLHRASLSVLLNIVEGAGRRTAPDKRNFYVVARASVFEVSEICDILHEEKCISSEELEKLNDTLEQLSKMLFKMIQVYTKK
ncbi:four helix bundle protein [Fulvivirga sedimenti]|uniref:Four helix bundle protein n=1 Tax=Fulvivirga sedimenti TaxID=2879465 RepID=A0A9X1HMF1_9BACT|nr:four helix bundle protein [Fulvivirga sedimenti]